LGRREENTGFACVVCGGPVNALSNGSYRNHCPFCLSSLHVDEAPGDRSSSCAGVMDAAGIVRTKKGWQIVHRCRTCGEVKRNRTAPDDDIVLLARLSG
jgi:hypothetical protein